MPNHVLAGEIAERDIVDVLEDGPHAFEARDAARQVELGHVARDHHLRAEAQAREEHLHLLRRGVLRLVEDDEAVVQGAPAHERERGDLDDAALDELRGALHVGHVEQRVVKRADVGIHLLGEGSGQKAQALPRFHHGAREDDAANLLALERSHGHGHGEVRLAGARGPDAERDGMLADGVDVALLARRLRTDGPAAVRELVVLAPRLRAELGRAQQVDGVPHVLERRLAAAFHELDEIREQRRERLHLQRIADELDRVAANRDPRGERILHDMEDLVRRADDERHVHASGGREGDLGLVSHGGIVPRTAGARFDVIEPTREYSAGDQDLPGTARRFEAAPLPPRIFAPKTRLRVVFRVLRAKTHCPHAHPRPQASR